jgi:hypothetical protein
MPSMKRALIPLIAIAASSVPAAALDITSCGVTVPRRGIGVLQADLSCPTSPFVVRLLPRATLDLNGHLIQGGDFTTAVVVGVGADDGTDPIGIGRGSFTIVGPGGISGLTHPPLNTGTLACVLVSDGRVEIASDTGTVELHHCVNGILGSSGVDPNGRARAVVAHAYVHDTVEAAIAVSKLQTANTSVSQNLGMGVSADRKLIATDVTANDNGLIGLYAPVIKGTNVTTQNNGNNGVDACVYSGPANPHLGRAVITNLVSTGNAVYGVCADRVRLRSSQVTANSYHDISAVTEPRLENTTCGSSSGMNGTTASWGVCSGD